jgi:hypothetical protein
MELVEPCPHADVDELGFSGGVVFLRCLLCGDVLVVDRGQEWTLCSDAIRGRSPGLSGTGSVTSRPRRSGTPPGTPDKSGGWALLRHD